MLSMQLSFRKLLGEHFAFSGFFCAKKFTDVVFVRMRVCEEACPSMGSLCRWTMIKVAWKNQYMVYYTYFISLYVVFDHNLLL